MKHKLLSILACQACGGQLELVSFRTSLEADLDQGSVEDVEEGILTCRCGSVYPISEGVPRILEGALFAHKEFQSRWKWELTKQGALREEALKPPSNEFVTFIQPTLRRFEKEWAEHAIEGRTWGYDQETRISHSLGYLGWTSADIKGKLILDAGAGTGQLTCSMATLGCEIVGIDLSPSVVRGWRARERFAGPHKSRVHIVQGDLMRPPFCKKVFDGVMSQGVLHHTPSTKEAFDRLVPLVRDGGTLGVWLYKETDGYLPLIPLGPCGWAGPRLSTLRKMTPRVPASVLYASLLLYAGVFHGCYSLNAALRKRSHNQTVKERATSLFDTLAPPYAWWHNPQEVTGWFSGKGFTDIRDTSVPNDVDGFCITGVRKV